MTTIIPTAALDQHTAILGKTGSGKTYTAKSIVEKLLDDRRQVCVLDPTGAWWGLRLGADGKARGYDVVLLGGAHADIPLAERSGAAVARLVTEQHASVVIDTSGFTVGEYTRWFIDFAGTLYTTIRSPLHLVIDEAHYFMPQGKSPDVDAGRMLHAGNRLMSGGRSKGIRGMLITQRPAKLHKDSLTCADTLIAMRVVAPQDRQAIKDWIDGMGDPAQGKAVLDSLAQLQRGEGWVWYPEGGHLKRVEFPKIHTYDSSATPKHGQTKAVDVGQIKLDEVKAALADAVKEAEANDPKLLRAKIARLEADARKAPVPVDDKATESAHAAVVEQLQSSVSSLEQDRKNLSVRVNELAEALEAMTKWAENAHHAVRAATELGKLKVPVWDRVTVVEPTLHVPVRFPAPAPRPRPTIERVARNVRRAERLPEVSHNGEALPKPLVKLIDAAAWWDGLGVNQPTVAQVGFVAGYTGSGGTCQRYLSDLASRGLIERVDGKVYLTKAGDELATKPDIPPTIEGLHSCILEVVKGPEAAILTTIMRLGPGSHDVESVAEQTEKPGGGSYEASGGTFQRYLSTLSSLGLVERRRGCVTPTDALFPEQVVP